VVDVGDERDGTKGRTHGCGDDGKRLEAATVFFELFFLPRETPSSMVRTGDGPTFHTGLSVLRPEESVEVVVRSFARSSLFEAPMSTLLQRVTPGPRLLFGSAV
jgi:hypothetical protein